jgi:hypothetical protein
MRNLRPIALVVLLLTTGARGEDSPEFRVIEPPKSFDLDPFYKKCVVLEGLPIVSSEKVSDYALKEAAYLIGRMLEGRKDVIDVMVKGKVRVAVMAYSERTVDIPEHRHMTPAAYWNRRARGLGGRTTSCGEENLLNYPGDPYRSENILIHEFAHCIHQQGLAKLDPGFNERLRTIYNDALAKGLWKGTYAASSTSEYWAEGVQSWFGTNRHDDRAHNHVDTREELKAYDPDFAALIAESFPNNDFTYIRPDQRKEPGHLLGYDPKAAPRFAWGPEETPAKKESSP